MASPVCPQVLIYNRTLNASEVLRVEAYLNTRYVTTTPGLPLLLRGLLAWSVLLWVYVAGLQSIMARQGVSACMVVSGWSVYLVRSSNSKTTKLPSSRGPEVHPALPAPKTVAADAAVPAQLALPAHPQPQSGGPCCGHYINHGLECWRAEFHGTSHRELTSVPSPHSSLQVRRCIV